MVQQFRQLQSDHAFGVPGRTGECAVCPWRWPRQSSSAYSTPWNSFPGNTNSGLLGGNNTDTGVNNIQYTAEFGNGVSASIGLDDPTVWNRTAVYNLGIPSAIGANGT